MIELTEQQMEAVAAAETPPVVVDPRTRIPYVLLRKDVYEQLVEGYDASPWTDEEMDLLAAEAGELLDQFGKDP